MSLLSEAGIARREAGLAGLKVVVRRRGQRRVAVRAGGIVAIVAAAGVWLMVMGRGSAPQPQRGGEVAANADSTQPVKDSVEADVRVTTVAVAGVGLVKTDPAVVEELAPSRAVVARLSDDELQGALREAGEPAGFVRIGKRVMVEGEFERGGM